MKDMFDKIQTAFAEALVVTTVDANATKNRADVVYQAKQNATKVGKFDPNTGSVSVYVDDVGENVVLGTIRLLTI